MSAEAGTQKAIPERRLAVDLALAKIEDAMAELRRLEPLNETERAHIKELAGILEYRAGELAGR